MGAFSSVPMTISFPARTGPSSPAPASRTGPGRADRERQRRCGGVGRACRQDARHAGPYPGNPLFCRGRVDHRRSRYAIAPRSCDQPDPAAAREPSQLSTWPDGKTITESNRSLAYLCKISAGYLELVGGPELAGGLAAIWRIRCGGDAVLGALMPSWALPGTAIRSVSARFVEDGDLQHLRVIRPDRD